MGDRGLHGGRAHDAAVGGGSAGPGAGPIVIQRIQLRLTRKTEHGAPIDATVFGLNVRGGGERSGGPEGGVEVLERGLVGVRVALETSACGCSARGRIGVLWLTLLLWGRSLLLLLLLAVDLLLARLLLLLH